MRVDFRLLGGSPAVPWGRLTSHWGGYFEIKSDDLKAYVNDYAVVPSRTYSDIASPGTTEIVWDFISPVREHNKTARKSYASISFTIRNCGKSATDPDATNVVSTKVWDQNSPHGRKLKKQNSSGHLKTFKTYAGFSLTDLGLYTLKESRNGRVVDSAQLTVVEPPTPDLAWMRRVGGQYTPIYAPFAAWVNDEWLIRNKDYEFPTPKKLGQTVRKQIEWNWLAPKALKINTTEKKSYLSVVQEYTGNGHRYRLVTTVFDRLHPRGRVYKVQEGNGNLSQSKLVYGGGLPNAGDFCLQEKINGVETELYKLQGREFGTTVELPQDLYVDTAPQPKVRIVTAPASYVEPNFLYTLTILDAQTGATIGHLVH